MIVLRALFCPYDAPAYALTELWERTPFWKANPKHALTVDHLLEVARRLTTHGLLKDAPRWIEAYPGDASLPNLNLTGSQSKVLYHGKLRTVFTAEGLGWHLDLPENPNFPTHLPPNMTSRNPGLGDRR